MFAFSPPQQTAQQTPVTDMNVPLGDYLWNSAKQGFEDSLFARVMRMTEDDIYANEGPILDPRTANHMYGIPGQLDFTSPISSALARIRRERKDAELTRQYYLTQGNQGGLFSARGLGGMGVGMLGSMLNPLDFGVMFALPIVGSEAAAAKLAAQGGGLMRQAMVRQLVTQEALNRMVPVVPKLTGSLIQGAGFAGVLEVTRAIENIHAGVPYDYEGVAGRAAEMTIGAGIFHLGTTAAGKALSKAFRSAMTLAGRDLERLDPGTHEIMAKEAMRNFLEGRDIDVAKYVTLDESKVRERVKFDVEAAQKRAWDNLSIEDVRALIKTQLSEMPAKAAARNNKTGEVLTGPFHALIPIPEGIQSVLWDGSLGDLLKDLDAGAKRLEDPTVARQVLKEARDLNLKFDGTPEDAVAALRTAWNDAWVHGAVTDKGNFWERRKMQEVTGNDTSEGAVSDMAEPTTENEMQVYDMAREDGLSDAEAINKVRAFRRQEVDRRFFDRPDVRKAIDTEYQRRVEQFIADEHAKYDEQGAFDREMRAEIEQQVKDGRLLTDEQMAKWGFARDDYKKITNDLIAENKTLQDELRAELEAEQLNIDETVPDIKQFDTRNKMRQQLIDEALGCMIRKMI